MIAICPKADCAANAKCPTCNSDAVFVSAGPKKKGLYACPTKEHSTVPVQK